MLLHSAPGRLRLFPALAEAWTAVSFDALRADGAILVSAAIEAGRLARVKLEPGVSTRIRLFLGDRPHGLDLDLVGGKAVDLDAAALKALEATPAMER